MKKPMMIPAVLLILAGVIVFFLPYLLSGQSGNAELASRTGMIGGAMIGVGIVFAALVWLSSPKQ